MALLRIGRHEDAGRVGGEALVLRTDPGISAMTSWSTKAWLQVTVPGLAPMAVEASCMVHRDKSLVAGTVLPVDVDPSEPERLNVRWDEVPTIEQRIDSRDPAILDPERAWRVVAAAGVPATSGISAPIQDQHPWAGMPLEGWPPSARLDRGRLPATALVISCSVDPAGYRSGDDWTFPMRRYSGTIVDNRHDYLGWLVLCVIPQSGVRFGLHVRKMLRRGHIGPVLPLAIHPEKPGDVEIPWRYSPDTVRATTARMLAANESALEQAERGMAERSAAAEEALGAIGDPAARAQTEEMLKKFRM